MVNSQEQPSFTNWRIILPLLLLLTAIIIALILFTRPGPQGQFRPQFSPNPPTGFVSGDPLILTFSELDSNPAVYHNKLVRVSGNYTRLNPIVCVPYKGPRPRWGLISEGFQMDVVGIEEIISLAPEGAPLVVEGVWRFYDGPSGCGKEPPHTTLWYLEARRIIEPNPLQFNNVPGEPTSVDGTAITTTVTVTPTIPITSTANTTDSADTNTPTPAATFTPLPTLPVATTTPATATATRSVNSVTATPVPGNGAGGNATPSPSGTTSGTVTPTPTGTLNSGNENGTPDPTEEALATSPSGTVSAPTLEPTPTPRSYTYP